jgi:hypothetical protein
MRTNYQIASSLFFMFLFLTMSLYLTAQETKETIILYNSIPVRAEIANDAEVKRVIREEPNYLKGYSLKIQDYGQFVVQDTVRPAEMATDVSQDLKARITTEESEFIEIVFDPGFATLSDQSVYRLDGIVKRLKNDSALIVTLRALSLKTDGSVTKNRLNSIKTYLRLRGVAHGRVLIEKLQGDRDADEVKIFYSK